MVINSKERRIIKSREDNWKLRSVLMANGKPLTYAVFRSVEIFQEHGCAICRRNEFWGALHADHNKKTGVFRGVLCSDCNHQAVGTYERTGHYKSSENEKILQAYLDNTPYQRWLAKESK